MSIIYGEDKGMETGKTGWGKPGMRMGAGYLIWGEPGQVGGGGRGSTFG